MNSSPSAPHPVAASTTTLDVADIQGVILRGYSHHPYIRFFILHIRDVPGAVEGAQKLCGLLATKGAAPLAITTAERWAPGQRPAYCLNLAVTSSGLRKLVDARKQSDPNQESNYEKLGPPRTGNKLFKLFNVGAADPAMAASIGDTGASDPANWWTRGNWKLPQPPTPANDELHLVVALYTSNAADRDEFATKFLAMIPPAADGAAAVVPAFVQDSDPFLDAAGKPTEMIHFGYVDGISQPRIKDTPWYKPDDPTDLRPPVESWNFVISPAAANYNAHPAFYNGCFGAFRLLYQDVGAFEHFIAGINGPNHDPDRRALVAAKMCGRWQDGTPLVLSPEKPDPSVQGKALNNFTYAADPDGQACPFASHIRRSNPRDDSGVRGNDNNAARHRVMRRARPYGPPYEADREASHAAQRGLVGFFLGANLTDQFQFIMQQWIGPAGFHNGDNSPNASGVDPMFGPMFPSGAKSQDFVYLKSPPHTSPLKDPANWQTVPTLSRFVRTDGALYIFIPSIKALTLFANGAVE